MEMAYDYHRQLNDSQAAVQFLVSEVDRLSRELAAANDSLALTASQWKSKYQTLQMELTELEGELLLTRAEASEAEEALGVAQRDVGRLTDDRTSSLMMVEALHREVATLKNVVNQQKLEKTELETVILSQRYSQHPGNVAAQSEITANSHSSGSSHSLRSRSLL